MMKENVVCGVSRSTKYDLPRKVPTNGAEPPPDHEPTRKRELQQHGGSWFAAMKKSKIRIASVRRDMYFNSSREVGCNAV